MSAAKNKTKAAPIAKFDRVRKRGFAHLGTVAGRSVLDVQWVRVTWDNGISRETPLWCYASELERVT